MPFSDFKLEDYLGYTLSNTRVKNKCDAMWEWEPLLESNGHGYFTRQEHVTPFIGKKKCCFTSACCYKIMLSAR